MFLYSIVKQTRHSNITIFIRNEIHAYNTRYNNLIELPKTRTQFLYNSLLHRGVNMFNKIPHTSKIKNVNLFKKDLKVLIRTYSI